MTGLGFYFLLIHYKRYELVRVGTRHRVRDTRDLRELLIRELSADYIDSRPIRIAVRNP